MRKHDRKDSDSVIGLGTVAWGVGWQAWYHALMCVVARDRDSKMSTS